MGPGEIHLCHLLPEVILPQPLGLCYDPWDGIRIMYVYVISAQLTVIP